MKNTEPRISVRVEPELKGRLERVAAHTGIDEATITRNCIEAFCAHVEKTGAITFPIAITTALENESRPPCKVSSPLETSASSAATSAQLPPSDRLVEEGMAAGLRQLKRDRARQQKSDDSNA